MFKWSQDTMARSSSRYTALLGLLAVLSPAVSAWATYPDTDVVIVSNNDLDPSNANRASALFLKSDFSCAEALAACEQLQETLLPAPNTTAGFTAQNLSVALTSERHGAALDRSQQIWIAGGECAWSSFSTTCASLADSCS